MGAMTAAHAWRSLGSRRLLAANVAFVALAGWAFAGEYARNRDAALEVGRLEAQAMEIRDANIASIEAREITPSEIEAEARVKLNMRRPGEEVVIVRGATGHALSDVPTRAPAAPDSNIKKWWKLFF